jgi:nucleoside-diphosphate-sugar epimerase
MRIFVAGSACVVGRLLLPKLVHEGHEVIGMTHKEENMAMIEKTPAPDVQPGSARWERGASNAKARLDYGWKPLYPFCTEHSCSFIRLINMELL